MYEPFQDSKKEHKKSKKRTKRLREEEPKADKLPQFTDRIVVTGLKRVKAIPHSLNLLDDPDPSDIIV